MKYIQHPIFSYRYKRSLPPDLMAFFCKCIQMQGMYTITIQLSGLCIIKNAKTESLYRASRLFLEIGVVV